jgi:hypothetical protein
MVTRERMKAPYRRKIRLIESNAKGCFQTKIDLYRDFAAGVLSV